MNINGKLIYSFDNLNLYEIEDNQYMLFDGGDVPVLFETMPQLNAAYLRGFTRTPKQLDGFELWQLETKGSVLVTTGRHSDNSNYLERLMTNHFELAEMQAIGY